MLQIGAHPQQRQLGVMMLGCPGGRSVLDRQGSSVEIVPCKRKRVNWNWVLRSRGTTTLSTLRSRSHSTRKGVVVMENSNMEQRAMEAAELENLVVGEPGLKQSSTFNSTLNKLSKWVTVVLIFGGILWRHDEHAVWFAVGSAANGGFSKCLKYLINDNRPPTAAGIKGDPGMPSSHAQGFSYVAAYASLALLLWQGINVWTAISILVMLLSFAYLSWLRVAEGLHTVPQVVVGSILGSAAAAFWLYVWKAGVEATVGSSLTAKFLLYMSFLAACVLVYFISFKDWTFGQP